MRPNLPPLAVRQLSLSVHRPPPQSACHDPLMQESTRMIKSRNSPLNDYPSQRGSIIGDFLLPNILAIFDQFRASGSDRQRTETATTKIRGCVARCEDSHYDRGVRPQRPHSTSRRKSFCLREIARDRSQVRIPATKNHVAKSSATNFFKQILRSG